MPARLLNGNEIANQIKEEVRQELQLLSSSGVKPGLAVVLVAGNPASEIYVRNKVRASAAVGLRSEMHTPPPTVSTSELLALIDGLNRRDDIDGILVQLPLPAQVDTKKVLMRVDPEKDVDGFHPMNVGLLVTQRPSLAPCTAVGIIEILRRSNIPISGANAVVVGRSDVVGKPVAALLVQENATVTVCHSKTRDLAGECRRADILIAAMGRAALVTPEFVKPGATVIDVGINRVTNIGEFQKLFPNDERRAADFATKGSVLVGDVHPEVAEVAGALTPVPGGVGPLTVAVLLANTVKAAKMRRGRMAESVAATSNSQTRAVTKASDPEQR